MSADIARAYDVRESIPGFSVLVKNGVNVAKNTSTFIAPRTTIGVNKEGQRRQGRGSNGDEDIGGRVRGAKANDVAGESLFVFYTMQIKLHIHLSQEKWLWLRWTGANR